MINIGSLVYPAEDRKYFRVTPCTVTKIQDNTTWVKGIFWGKEDEGEQTLQFSNTDYKSRPCLGYWENAEYSYWLLTEDQVPEYLKTPNYYD